MKKEQVLLAISILILIGSITYANCGLQVRPDASLGIRQNSSSQTTKNADQSLTETFMQPSKGTIVVKPEIVFVVDTSASMMLKVSQIKTALSGWINQLSVQGVNDFCLGAMTTKNPTSAGLLVSASGNQKCYCTFGAGAVSPATVAIKFGENLDAVLATTGNGGTEEAMIYSMTQALTDPAKLASNQSAGCFRNDTTIVPVLVSDEEDVSAAPNKAGYNFDQSKLLPPGQNFSSIRGNPYYNFDNSNEAVMRRNLHCRDHLGNFVVVSDKYVNQIDFESLHDEVIHFNGSFPSFGSSIGFYPLHLPDPSIYSEPFWGGMQFAEMFSTEMVDLKDAMDGHQSAFQDRMNAMADSLAENITYFNKFDLQKPVCDTNADGDFSDEGVIVKIDNVVASPTLYSISTSGQKVTINQSYTWSPGATVDITYKPCKE